MSDSISMDEWSNNKYRDLRGEIFKIHEESKSELVKYVLIYNNFQSFGQDAEVIIDTEKFIDEKIDQSQFYEAFALVRNVKSLELKKNKDQEVIDFIDDAIKSALANLRNAKISMEYEDYADVLRRSLEANKAIGFLEVAEKLSIFDKFFKEEKKNKSKAGHASHSSLPVLKQIVLSVAQKKANLFSSKSALFRSISPECNLEIIKQLPFKKIRWKDENLFNVLMRHSTNDMKFGQSINSLIKKKQRNDVKR